jgi:hypothetical protein
VTSVFLTFSGNEEVKRYIVKRDGKVIYDGQNIMYKDQGLVSQTTYVYEMEAYDGNNNLLGKRTVTVTTK